ncbi:MAG TPA: metalloregulator ArsR/SmtB family transcription factor [Usitatibacter sp.]|jgi:ArsR family transcriptional regulator|nr:metalloregulator ArsR/SmtB family transcription factor [Usitatibacter sp.]
MPTTTRARPRTNRKVSNDIFELIGKGEYIKEASAAMQAMAHPLRLKILCLVGNQELSVLEIVDAVGTSQSNVSQHLAVLRDTGVLKARKESNKVFYRINDPRVLEMISLTRRIFCSF